MIYAGIDEAGLGPVLGPFTVGTVVFSIREGCGIFANPDELILEPIKTVAEFNPSRGSTKLLIRDSKELFSQSGGIRRLEEAALAFAAASQPTLVLPAGMDVFVNSFWQPTEPLTEYPWHGEETEALSLPVQAETSRVTLFGQEVARCLGERGIAVNAVHTTIVPVCSFNRLLAASTNKATATFSIIRQLIGDLWRTSPPGEDLLVRVDKQGGRDNYLPVLEGCIDEVTFQPVVEGSEESRYIVEQGTKRMIVHFALRSDAAFLPVTLAGIMAKYARELLMGQQNKWFTAKEPRLAPTAGYPLDAKRWLRESLEIRRHLGIKDALLIRNR